MMDVNAFLNRPRLAWRRVQALKARRERCLDRAQRLSASYGIQTQGSAGTGGARCPDMMAEFVCMAVDMEPGIARATAFYVSEHNTVARAIDLVPRERERQVLMLRHLNMWIWERIAVEMRIGSASVRMTHCRAIRRLRQDSAWQIEALGEELDNV